MEYSQEISHFSDSCTDKQAWTVTFSAACFFFYQFMLINIFNALNEPMLREFNITATHLGHVSASYFISSMLCLIPAGFLLDRFSTRKILLIALSSSITCTFLFGLAPNPNVAMFARFLAGFGGAFCFLGPVHIASRWFSANKLALIIGLIVSFGMLGGIIAQTPATVLAEHIGWRKTVFIMASAGILMLSLIYFNVQDNPSNTQTSRKNLNALPLLPTLRVVLLNCQNWLGGLYISLLNLPVFLFGAMWGTLYLTQVHNLSRTQSTFVTSMIFVGMIFGSPFMGWVSDKIGLRKPPMIIFGMISIIPIALLMGAEHRSLISLMSIFFSIGFVISAQIIGYPFVAEHNSKAHTGTAEGLASTLMIAGGLTQPLFAWLMEYNWDGKIQNGLAKYSTHDFNRAIMLIPIAFSIAVICILMSKEKLNTTGNNHAKN